MTGLAAIFLSASVTFSLPPGLLSALCFVESSHRPHILNMDDNGSPSIGECQIKLATARSLGYRGSEEMLRTNAKVNIYYAAKYLRHQLDRYKQDSYMAIGAYNSGSYTHRNRHYVRKVIQAWAEKR